MSFKGHLPDKDSLENTPCPLCNNESGSLVCEINSYKYNKCNNCQLVYLNPRLNEKSLLAYYAQDSFYTQYSAGTGYEVQEKALRSTFSKYMKELHKRNVTGGKLLEIGCGFGFLLDEAKDFFGYRIGTDFSNEAVNHAKKYADNVYCGGLEAVPDDSVNKFDCVITFSVLEHVYNPNTFITEIENYMTPKGRLVVSTPFIGGMWYKVLGKKWPFFIPPEHVCLYNHASISRLLEQNGFKDIQIFISSHAWPISVFLSKVGMHKLSSMTTKLGIGNSPLFVPSTIINVIGSK
jgi:2-polyprenyl-3-methyl-5-hydroxy-6-metoxy-1,4-benzoquinol methylase